MARAVTLWLAIAATAAGCFALKLFGTLVPRRVLDQPAVARMASLVPVALLPRSPRCRRSRPATDWWSTPGSPGSTVALVAVLLRAPFLVVVPAAAATAAPLRAL